MTDLKNIEDTFQLQITWEIGYFNNLGVFTLSADASTLNTYLQDLYFQPNFAILRKFSAYQPTAGRDDGQYRIISNISNQVIATFVNGNFNLPQHPDTIISIRKPINNLSFNLEHLYVNPADGKQTWVSVVQGTPAGNWTHPFSIQMTFDLISVKGYDSNRVPVP